MPNMLRPSSRQFFAIIRSIGRENMFIAWPPVLCLTQISARMMARQQKRIQCWRHQCHTFLYNYCTVQIQVWKTILQGSGICLPPPQKNKTIPMFSAPTIPILVLLLSRVKTNSKQFHAGFSFRKQCTTKSELQLQTIPKPVLFFPCHNCKAPPPYH